MEGGINDTSDDDSSGGDCDTNYADDANSIDVVSKVDCGDSDGCAGDMMMMMMLMVIVVLILKVVMMLIVEMNKLCVADDFAECNRSSTMEMTVSVM